MKKLLLLSGGCLVGQNILDVLVHRRKHLKIIATNSDPNALPLSEYDKVYMTPTTAGNPEIFEKRILEIIANENPDLIIPCRDDDVLFLAELGERHPELQPQFLCGNYSSTIAMVDKGESWLFCQREGLPFAPSLITPVSPKELTTFTQNNPYPLLAKPKKGFAAHGVFFILNREQLEKAAVLDNYVIQRFLGNPEMIKAYQEDLETTGIPLFHTFEGIKHSIEIFIDPQGKPKGNFCSRNVNRYGTSLHLSRYEGEDAKRLGEKCLSTFARAGWRGPINIQCQETPEGELIIYEFNNRITGATAARYHMGYDEVGLSLKHFINLDLMEDYSGSPKVWRKAVDITVNKALSTTLEKEGVWEL